MVDTINFDLAPVTLSVTIFGTKYILRETSGEAHCQYRNALSACAEYVGDTLLRYRNLANLEPLLVSLCLYDSSNTNPVPEDVIRSWPSRIQSKLFKTIKEISGMDIEEETRESLLKEREEIDRKLAALDTPEGPLGNSSEATMAGSG